MVHGSPQTPRRARGARVAPTTPHESASAALDSLASSARSLLGLELSGAQRELFHKYLRLLQKWQRAQRLIGSSDERWVVENLFVDSLLFAAVLPDSARSAADVGSGAGLPGVPLKIVRPHLRMTLIESRARRASFLSTVVRELDLEGVHVENARLDSMIASRPERFDAVVMRCAGDISSLLQRAAGLLNPGGAVIAAGPPVRRALSVGDWVEVPRRDRNPRLFAVYRPGKPG